MLSEALALAEKRGVGRAAVLSFVEAFLPAPSIVGYARRIAEGALEAGQGFTVDLGLKDGARGAASFSVFVLVG